MTYTSASLSLLHTIERYTYAFFFHFFHPAGRTSCKKEISWLNTDSPWISLNGSRSNAQLHQSSGRAESSCYSIQTPLCCTAKQSWKKMVLKTSGTAALIWRSSGWFWKFLAWLYIQSFHRWRKALDFGNKAASCWSLSTTSPQSGPHFRLLSTDSSAPFNNL